MLLVFTLLVLAGCETKSNQANLILTQQIESIAVDEIVSLEFTQTKGQTYLLEVNGFEAELEISVFSDGASVVEPTGTPFIRLAPGYIFLAEVPQDREVRLEILPIRLTRRSTLDVQIYELPMLNRADEQVARAFQLYSGATGLTDNEGSDLWQARIDDLLEAAKIFDRFDNSRAAHWARALAAFYTYWPLNDSSESARMAHRYAKQAREAGFPEIELFNLNSEGQALRERAQADTLIESMEKQSLAQQQFQIAEKLAAELGLDYELAWTINNRGIGYYYLDQHSKAIEQYEAAFSVIQDMDDSFTEDLIRGNLVLAHEKTGDFSGAIATLTDINKNLRENGFEGRLLDNLTELGRVYRRLYRFPEGVEALSEALDIAAKRDNQEMLGRAAYWLAQAYYAMGYQERSREYLEQAIPHFIDTDNGGQLRDAYRLSANLYRTNHAFEQMTDARAKQFELLSNEVNHASHFYESGLDTLAKGLGLEQAAYEQFARVLTQSDDLENPEIQSLALLRACGIKHAAGSKIDCSSQSLNEAYKKLTQNPDPTWRLESMQAMADVQLATGDAAGAIETLDQLIKQMQFFRQALPGVLGAWYWESRSQVFQSYMDLLVKQDLLTGNGMTSLLALDRLRNSSDATFEDQLTATNISQHQQQQQIRSLLALRSSLSDEKAIEDVERQLDRELLSIRTEGEIEPLVSREWLTKQLALLPEDSALLTYHFSASGSWVWLASQRGVVVKEISDSGLIAEQLKHTLGNFRTFGYQGLEKELEDLGKALLTGVQEALPEKIYILPGGVLTAFPLEALTIENQHLFENHQVVNLMSLSGIQRVVDARPVVITKAFAAGAPSSNSATQTELKSAASELKLVAEAFPDADISHIDGDDLVLNVFKTSMFSEAELIHISTHAEIDLAYPELSRIILSDNAGETTYITPFDIQRIPLSAEAVFLAACETVGANIFEFENDLGFVSSFLDSGSNSVVASLWPVGDQASLVFMQDVYRRMGTGMSVIAAITETKRRLFETSGQGNIDQSVAYQVFVR